MTAPKLTEGQRERLLDIDAGDAPTWDEAHFFENSGLIEYIEQDDGDTRYTLTPAGRAVLRGES